MGIAGQWPEFIKIGKGCVQRHLGPRHIESPFSKLAVAASGISELTGFYSISRASFPCHVVFFTLEGEGKLETREGAWSLTPGTAMTAPSGVAARYSLASQRWRILWFDLCDALPWAFLRGSSAKVMEVDRSRLAKLEAAMEGVYEELQEGQAQEGELTELLCREAALRVRRLLGSEPRPAEQPYETELRELFLKVEGSLQRDWSVKALARELSISEPHLYRLCAAVCKSSPMEHVRSLRMERASKLLTESNAPVSDIADSVGYGNALNFSTAFRNFAGASPRAFRLKARQTP